MRKDSFVHQVVRNVVASLVSLVVVLAVIAGIAYLALNQDTELPDHGWLVIDLYGDLPAYDPPGSFPANLISDTPLTLQTALDALGKAAVDDRVEGVIWKLSSSNNAGWGKLEELRQATGKVRQAGKPVIAWGDAMSLRTMYLAAACDSIFMPRGGYFDFQGMMRQTTHVKGALDKLGIQPHVSKIRDYKSAAEIVMETQLTEPSKQQAQRLMDAAWHEVSHTVADERGLPYERLLELLELGSLEPLAAAEAGVIDEVRYWQELEAGLVAQLDDDDLETLPTITPDEYRDVPWSELRDEGDVTVAVVHAQGTIGGRENNVNPLLGMMMGHESVVRELQRARLDDEVDAIVFRVDSGGGDGLTSDLIGHEVDLCAQAKPTVVSMVDVAASGGYQISFRASHLMADAMSVVGSIGSISAFFDMSDFYAKIGVSKDSVEAGPMASLGRDDRAPTEAEWQAFQTSHYAGFNDWLQQVADRRGLSFAEMEERAYGRVFTGREALELDLIDSIGNLDEAIAKAVELAGIDTDEAPRVVHLPEPVGTLDELMGNTPGRTDPVTLALRWKLYSELRQELQLTRHMLTTEAVLNPVPR